MKKALLLLIVIIALPIMTFASEITVIENSDSVLRIRFDLPEYQFSSLSSSAQVQFKTESNNMIRNNLNLPIMSYLMQVPNNTCPQIRVINQIYTKKENIDIDKIDQDIIVNNDFVSISAPFIMRNNLLSTLAIQPFTYDRDSRSLKIYTMAEIEIEFMPNTAYKINHEIRQTKEMKNWLSQSVINYQDRSRLGEGTGSLLIFYNQNAAALSYIQPLIDWKHQKGWEVHAVSTTTLGNSSTQIKNYIQTAYNTWANPPEYILMLGRVTGSNSCPTYTEFYNYNTVGDYRYTLLEGGDMIPDAYIGRLTFASTDQLQLQLNKILAYEKKQGLSNTDWFNRTLFVADSDASGVSCATTIDYIKSMMLEYNPTMAYTYVSSGYFPSQITTALNQGDGNFYYRGHGEFSGLTNTDINGLSNTGKYPFISFITCFSGNFNNSSTLCIGETFLRAGTPAAPKGGIGFIGTSTETHTCLNNIMTGGIAYGFFREGMTTQGQVEVRAKVALLTAYPQYPDDYIPQNFQSLNLLGDPSVDIWLKQPVNITVTHSSTAALTNGFLSVSVVDASGIPVKDAKVCLLKGNDEIFQVVYTDLNGQCVLQWGTVTAGTGTLTVTKQNISTYQATITFAAQQFPLQITNMQPFENLCTGTDYTFPVSIINNQYTSLSDINATLTCSSEHVNITNGNLTFNNINIGQTAQSNQSVALSLSEYCPKHSPINFILTVTGMNGQTAVSYQIPFTVTEYGPNLAVTSSNIGTDNLLTPGENTQITFTLNNIGDISASSITGTLYSLNSSVTITNSTQSFGSINAGQSGTNSTAFGISAASSLYIGTPVTLKLVLSYNSGSTQIDERSITIGNPTTTAMTGPDAYGYICVKNNDTHPLAQPYSWIELDPSSGGTGTSLTLTDSSTDGSGSWTALTLPFTFRYYGQIYNQVAVCSNGFLMPGSQGSQEWMNWPIPGPMVPRPIIAPFWDDLLIQTNSKILYKYDATNHKYIVSWSQLRNKFNSSLLESFQVVIFDAQYYTSPTGDNPFLFQYKDFNNVDAGNYGVNYVDHGQYATVGIADHTGLVGLQYTYQNEYPATAATLAANSTLYFTTLPTYQANANPIVMSYNITEQEAIYPNNQIESGETIAISPLVSNTGLGFLANATATLTTTDSYVSILTATSSINELDSNESGYLNSPFIFSVANNCPNLHQVNFTMTLTANAVNYAVNFSVLIHANEVEFNNVLVNGFSVINLDPGVGSQVQFEIHNLAQLQITNASLVIQNSSQYSVQPASFNVNIPANGSQQCSFTLTPAATVVSGTTITLTADFTIGTMYSAVFTKQFIVGSFDSMLSESFTPDSFTSWITTPGIALNNSQYINQTGYEVVITPQMYPSGYVLYSPLIDANDLQYVYYKFKYVCLNGGMTNLVYALYNDSIAVQIYDFSGLQQQVTQIDANISSLPADVVSFRLVWAFQTEGASDNIVALDDIDIRAIHHPCGYISGFVTLEDTSVNVQDVVITTQFYPLESVHPDATGHYILPLYQGNYSYVKAMLNGHLTQYVYDVNIVSGQTINNTDFNIPKFLRPINLTHQLSGNSVTLNWELEQLVTKEGLRLNPNYYRIWFVINNAYNLQDTTSNTHYTRALIQGNYSVYVKSVYIGQDGAEFYSDSSNTITFTYTPNADETSIPVVLDLAQNFPNPFNPRTTIKYSVPSKQHVAIKIYNLKGQMVRTLVSKTVEPGYYSTDFDGKDDQNMPVSTGIYFYRIETKDKTITKKMILMK